MRIAAQITRELDSMTRSEAKVAAFALGHLHDIAFYTLEVLAKQVDVSTTTVLRFCRRLGFEGYMPFRQAARQELRNQPDLMDKLRRTADRDTDTTLLSQTLARSIDCIQTTFRELSPTHVQAAVERIAGARRVYTFGMRESFALAHYAYTRFQTVREDVYLLGRGDGLDVEAVLSLTPEDVCVVYLFHRYTRQSLHMLELLKEQGVPVILITSPPCDEIERFAAVLLPCQVDLGGIKNSSVAPVSLADYLCNAVAMTHMDRTMERMKQCEALYRRGQIL